MKRTLLVLVLAAVPILSTGQSDAPVRRPEVRVGDSWTYRATNLLSPGTHEHETRVGFADNKLILAVSTRKSDGKEFDSSWTAEWNAVKSYSEFMYRPHTGAFRFPLRIGDEYEAKYELLRPRTNKVVSNTTRTVKVVGWETVEVPAGTFRAIRVVAEGLVQPMDGSNAWRQQTTYWYSPEVRRWVKLQNVLPKFTASEELLAYKLNED
jgi:hypothetical protein